MLRWLHPELIPHPAGCEHDRRFAGRRVLRFDPVHQPRPEHFAAVGNRRRQHRHLQRRHQHRILADAEVGRVAIGPASARVRVGKCPAVSCRSGKSDLFAQMKPVPQPNNTFRLRSAVRW